MAAIIGLWLNNIPDTIMNSNDSLRELSDVILQGYLAQKMVVAGSALLITMMKENCLPKCELKSVANNLKTFLDRKRIPSQEVNAITLTSYDDFQKWETIKEQITAAVGNNSREGWDSKPLEQWSIEDTRLWLTANNLEQYCAAFKENDMDGRSLMDLNEADLRDLGIRSIGHRKTLMRNLTEAKKFVWTPEEVHEVATSPTPYQDVANQKSEFQEPKDQGYKSLMIRGLPTSLLEDEDTLFDIENLAFTGFFLDSFKPTAADNGILVTFEKPLTIGEKDKLKEKFKEVMKRLNLENTQWKVPLTFDFWENGKIVELRPEPIIVEDEIPNTIENEFEEEKVAPPPSPKRMNYWEEFWTKLITNGDPDDFFDDEGSKLNLRGAREVLATIRDVKLKEVKKDDPGVKYLKGFTKAEIEANLSDCVVDVMYEIEKRRQVENPPPKEESPPLDKPDKDVYVGMSMEGLPRRITDDDNTIHGIQSIVFRDVPVRRLIVIDDRNPPALKVEFEKHITKEKIPQLARNLKNFLKAVNVDQAALNDVTIAFIEEGLEEPPKPAIKQKRRPAHRRTKTDDFLVAPGDSVEMTRTFMIEGIPEKYLNQDSFLIDMPEKVFDGVPLEKISVPPATMQPDGSISQTSLEIRFKTALNIQKLPKVAMKLKKFLKRKQIPPSIVNQVTLQVRHEETAKSHAFSEVEAIVGLIFKGIPKKILESNDALHDLENDVFTNEHPIRLMEPNEADEILRIAIEEPIRNPRDLTTIAHRLKRFLAKQGIRPAAINDVLVMSFNREKWPQTQPLETPAPVNPNTYIGIEIENMPASVVDSDQILEEIERIVFAKQKVVHMNVLDTTLRITFRVAANPKAIENVARQLKTFLTQIKIPINQINDIIIEPHTEEAWDQA